MVTTAMARIALDLNPGVLDEAFGPDVAADVDALLNLAPWDCRPRRLGLPSTPRRVLERQHSASGSSGRRRATDLRHARLPDLVWIDVAKHPGDCG